MKKPVIFAAIILISIVFMNLMDFSIFKYTSDEGWYVTNEDVTTYMQNGEARTSELIFIDSQEPIYERLGSLFVTDKKLALNTSYPVFVGEDASSLYFSDGGMSLITDEFGSLPTYDGLYLSAGVTYNTDRTRADNETFILTYMPDNGLFLAAQNIIVNTVYGEKVVPMNSVVDFSADTILYMAFAEGELQGDKIAAMNQATITIGDTTYNYYNFLVKLGLLTERLDNEGNQEVVPDVVLEEELVPEKDIMDGSQGTPGVSNLNGDASDLGTLGLRVDGETSEDEWETTEEDEDDIDWQAEDEWKKTKLEEDDDESLGDAGEGEDDLYGTEEPLDGMEPVLGEDGADEEGFNFESGMSGDDGSFNFGDDDKNNSNNNNDPADPTIPIYTMPTVTIDEDSLETWVYTVGGEVTISDPDYRMAGGVTLALYTKENGVEQFFMRKVVYNTGDFLMTFVKPDTEFILRATYYQYNNSGVKEPVEVLVDGYVVKTLGIEELEGLEFTPLVEDNQDDASPISEKQVVVRGLGFQESMDAAELAAQEEANKPTTDDTTTDDTTTDGTTTDDTAADEEDDEPYVYTALDTIAYINSASVEFSKEGKETSFVTRNLTSSNLSTMKAGKQYATFTSAKEFDTDTTYDFKITYYDKYGNIMPTTTDAELKGMVRTCKEMPTATVTMSTASYVGNVIWNIVFDNPDEASLTNVKMYVYDEGGNSVNISGELNGQPQTYASHWVLGTGAITGVYQAVITNLAPSTFYTVEIKCDTYDVEDNIVYGTTVLDSKKFYTKAITTLGSVSYTTEFSNYSDTGVTSSSNMGVTTNEVLKLLLTRVEISVTDGITNIFTGFTEDDLDAMTAEEIAEKTTTVSTSAGTLYRLELPIAETEEGEISVYLEAQSAEILADPWEAYLATASTNVADPNIICVIDGMESNTKSTITIDTFASQGGKEYPVSAVPALVSATFTTMKQPPLVTLTNQFTAGDFHQIFDFMVYDKDGAIANGTNGGVTVGVYQGSTLIQSFSMNTTTHEDFDEAEKAGETYDNHRFSNLIEGQSYTLKFIAAEYNDGGSVGRQYQVELAVDAWENEDLNFTTGDGVTGSLALDAVGKIYYVLDEADENGDRETIKVSWTEMNLMNAIKNGVLDGSITFKDDYYVGASTTETNRWSSNTTYTGFEGIGTDIFEPGKTYVFAGGDGYDIHWGFFDEDDKLILRTAYYDSYSETMTVPEGTAYTNMSVGYDRAYNYGILFEYDETLSGSLADNDDILNVETGMNDEAAQEGYYVHSNSGFYTSALDGIYITDYISVYGGALYEVTGKQHTSAYYMNFYDKYKQLIRTWYCYQDGIIQVPEEAAYMRTTVYKEDYTPVEDVYGNETVMEMRRYAAMEVNYLNGAIDVVVKDNDNVLEDLMKDVDGGPKYTVNLYSATLENAANGNYGTTVVSTVNNDIPLTEDGLSRAAYDTISFGNLNKGYGWKAELVLNMYGVAILLDELTFTTEASVNTISNEAELLAIAADPSADYVVINDFTTTKRAYTAAGFSGTLDLQGYTITFENTGFYSLFSKLESTGVIRNGVFDMDIIASTTYSGYDRSALLYQNYGLVEDVVVNMSVDYGDYDYAASYRSGGITVYNYTSGIIQNFVLNNETPIKVNEQYGGVAYENYGTIQDGWTTGECIRAVNYVKDEEGYLTHNGGSAYYIANVVRHNEGLVQNVFTLNDVWYDKPITDNTNYQAGLVSGYNAGTLRNAYSVGHVYEYDPTTNTSEDVYDSLTYRTEASVLDNFGGARVMSNLWHVKPNANDVVDEETYEYVVEPQITKDILWQESVIDGNGQFQVSELIGVGYYPNVEMGTEMIGKQPKVDLPDADASSMRIISTLIEKQSFEYVDAIITVENPNNYEVTGFVIDGIGSCEIVSQGIEEDKYRVHVRLTDPSSYVSKYTVNSISYKLKSGSINSLTLTNVFIYAKFYREIWDEEDWDKYVRGDTSGNYRLADDIDFTGRGFDTTIYVSGIFTGELLGGKYDANGNKIGMFKLENIYNDSNNYGYVFNQVRGVISDIIIDGYEMDGNTPLQYAGFIREVYNDGWVQNVHIRNSNMFSYQYMGAIAAMINYGTVVECSSTNVDMAYMRKDGSAFIEVGGIAGRVNQGSIIRCYAQDLDINLGYVENVTGVGGIVGYAVSSYGYVGSCWTSGKIEVYNRNLGGIVGCQASGHLLQECWSIVDIFTVGDGVSGVSGTGYGTVYNVLALGDLVSRSSDVTEVNRIAQGTVTNGYAYDMQLLNGEMSPLLNGALALYSREDLIDPIVWEDNIRIGDDFDLNGGSVIFADENGTTTKGVDGSYMLESKKITVVNLPLLLYEDGTAIYGQEQIQLSQAELDIDIYEVVMTDVNTKEFRIKLYVEVDEKITVDNYSIHMTGAAYNEPEVSATTEPSQMEVNITGTLTNAWDSYMVYVTANGADQGTVGYLAQKVEFGDYKDGELVEGTGTPIYETIDNSQQWVEYLGNNREDTFENLKITGDINFYNYKNIYSKEPVFGVSLNRLEGDNANDLCVIGGENATKLLDYTATTERFSFIQTVVTNVENIDFRDIKLDSTTQTCDKTGIIGKAYADFSNVEFNNIDLSFGTGTAVGCIGVYGGHADGVTMENIQISSTSGSFIGGFAGQLDNATTELDNISLVGTRTLNSGGTASNPDDYTYTNNIISTSTTSSHGQIGGIYGYMDTQLPSWGRAFNNLEVSGTKVEARYRVGGIGGTQVHYIDTYDCSVTDSYMHASVYVNDSGTRYGGYQVGGMFGYAGYIRSYNFVVENTFVVADWHTAGGYAAADYSDTNMFNGLIIGCDISAGYYNVGGFTAGRSKPYYCTIQDSVIRSGTNPTVYDGDESTYPYFGWYAGGLMGQGMSVAFDNTVDNCTIEGTNYVGGIMGRDTYLYNQNIYSNVVMNTDIEGEMFVGGIAGQSSNNMYRNLVNDCTIKGTTNVGGISGLCYSPITQQNGVGDGVTVTGDLNVGGIYGYISYLNIADSVLAYDEVTTMQQCYSAATVTGDNYVGGLIGLYETGADGYTGNLNDWPREGETGAYYGTPTIDFPEDYTGLLFFGNVNTTGDSEDTYTYKSLWGNGLNRANETGLNASRIYVGSKLDGVVGAVTGDIAAVTDATTSAGLSYATARQLNQEAFYSDDIANGGMDWYMTNSTTASSYLMGTVADLVSSEVELFQSTDGTITLMADATTVPDGSYEVTFSNGGAGLADEYVSDELVLWLDAKNSQGFGIRNEVGTAALTGETWVNLASSGSAYNGTISATTTADQGFVWNEDGLYTDAPNNGTNYIQIPDIMSLMTNTETDGFGEYTIQFVYQNDYLESYGNYYGALMCEAGDYSDAFAYGRGTHMHIFYVGNYNNVNMNADPDEYMVTFVSDYDETTGTQYKKMYLDGSASPDWTTSSTTTPAPFLQGDLRWGRGTWNTSTNQTLSAVRVYNKVLSTDELARNAAADAALYGESTGVGSLDAAGTKVSATFSNGVATISGISVADLTAYVNISVGTAGATMATVSDNVFVSTTAPSLTLKNGGSTVSGGTTYTTAPQITVSGGVGENIIDSEGNVTGTADVEYTWYRTTKPVASGGTAVETLTGTDLTRYLDGRGYYYCVDGAGNTSPVVLVDTPNYMFYTKGYHSPYSPTDGSEGLDRSETALNTRGVYATNAADRVTAGTERVEYDYFATNDKWYSGGVELPNPGIATSYESATAPVAVANMLMRSFEMIIPDPPEATIYPSSEKTLNIEFDDTIPYNDDTYAGTSYFQIYADDVLVDQSYIDNRVYTFEYDFVTDLTIVVSNGDESLDLTYEVEAEDMQRSVMTCGDEYYYISPDGVSYSTGSFAAQFVHLMNGKGITATGGVYDVSTGYIVEAVKAIATIQEEAIPMFSGTSQGLTVDAFATFSEYGGNTYEKVEYVMKDDYLYTIPVDGTIEHDGFIVDTYGDKMYFGLLSTGGALGDLTGNIVIPEDISTSGINHMTHTIDSDSHYVLIRYNSNKVAGFDYVTGELLDLTQPDDISYGIVEFFNDNVATLGITTTMSFASSYVEAVELQDAIETDDSMAQILNDGTIYESDGFDDESVSGLGDEEIITEDTEADGEVDGVTDVVGEGVIVADEDFVDGDGSEDGEGTGEDVDGDLVDGDNTENGDGTSVAGVDSDAEENDIDQESKESGQTSKEETAEDVEGLWEAEDEEIAGETGTATNVGTTEAERKAAANSAQRYIVAYNQESGGYELYRTADLAEDAEAIVSETQKVEELQKTGALPEFTKGTVAQGQQNRGAGINIFTVVVVSIGGLVLILVFAFASKRRKKKKTFASRIGKDE